MKKNNLSSKESIAIKWLLLDFSTQEMGLGIWDGKKLHTRVFSAGRDMNNKIVQKIADFWNSLYPGQTVYFKRVGLIDGPGGFTGLRTACTIANTAAFVYGRGQGFDGIVSLDALSAQIDDGEGLSVIPAGKKEVFAAVFRGGKIGEVAVLPVASLGGMAGELVGVLPYFQEQELVREARAMTKRRLTRLLSVMQQAKKMKKRVLPSYGKEPNITYKNQGAKIKNNG